MLGSGGGCIIFSTVISVRPSKFDIPGAEPVETFDNSFSSSVILSLVLRIVGDAER